MLKQTIQFTDYNGQPREITEYFHLNEAEIVDMQAKSVNGIQADMQDAILSNDAGRVLDFIKDLVHRSYGKKSADGLTFEKSPEILQRFINSAYYSDFLLGLILDNGKKGEEFVRGIMPAKLVERAMAQVQGQEGGPVDRTVYAPDAREVFAQAQAAKTDGMTEVGTTGGAFAQTQAASREAGTFSQPEADPLRNAFGQPEQKSPTGPSNSEEWAAFQAWQDQQNAAKATQAASAPASPDAFRIREEEPMQGLSRPPHEQIGDAQ